MNCSFPSANKIRESSVFQRAFLHPARSNKLFSLYTVENNLHFSRLGMVISKRAIPSAVSRNRIKRLIREYFRMHSSSLAPLDYIVRIRRNPGTINFVEINNALTQMFLNRNTK